MTHDELLAKIYPDWDEYVDNSKFRDALRAVVKLHKPWTATEDDRYWDGFRQEIGEQCCHACAMPSIYPCPTIQAIEKELA